MISLKPLFWKGHGFVYFVVMLEDEGSIKEIVEVETELESTLTMDSILSGEKKTIGTNT